MAWAWVYLAVSVVGALLVANAFRPARHPVLGVPSFFAGLYTAEMPVWHIVWQVGATVAFALEGALGSWPGWVALGVNAASWTGLVVHARVSGRARDVFTMAEEEMPLPVAEGDVVPLHGGQTMWRFPRLVFPLPRPARSVQVVRNIDYAGDGTRAHRLDIIRRRVAPAAGAPVLVYIHGGAWVIGDKREQGLPLTYELARRGWVAVTINYRLSPKATWPDHIVDCKRAVAWVRAHIAQYGGDPGFIAVSGGSAGGHLAALLALSPGDPGVPTGVRNRRLFGRSVRAFLRRVRHDRWARRVGVRRRPPRVCSSAACSSGSSRTTPPSSKPRPRSAGCTPRRRRSSCSTGPTTPWCRWATPGRS